MDLLTKQYSELEDEFRMALEIESRRFNEVSVLSRVSLAITMEKDDHFLAYR